MTVDHGQPHERDALVALWRASTEATHAFLSAQELDRMAERLRARLSSGHMTVRVWRGQDLRPRGFAGVIGQELWMLFVHPEAMGQGIGRALLDCATRELGARSLEVDARNARARRLYERAGFVVASTPSHDPDSPLEPLRMVRPDEP